MRGTPLRGSQTLLPHLQSRVRVEQAVCVRGRCDWDGDVSALCWEAGEDTSGSPSEVRWLGDTRDCLDKG